MDGGYDIYSRYSGGGKAKIAAKLALGMVVFGVIAVILWSWSAVLYRDTLKCELWGSVFFISLIPIVIGAGVVGLTIFNYRDKIRKLEVENQILRTPREKRSD